MSFVYRGIPCITGCCWWGGCAEEQQAEKMREDTDDRARCTRWRQSVRLITVITAAAVVRAAPIRQNHAAHYPHIAVCTLSTPARHSLIDVRHTARPFRLPGRGQNNNARYRKQVARQR